MYIIYGPFVLLKIKKLSMNSDMGYFNTLWFSLLTFHRKYGLDENTVDFIGHALALHRDDHYLDEPALDTVKRMKVNVLDYYTYDLLFQL